MGSILSAPFKVVSSLMSNVMSLFDSPEPPKVEMPAPLPPAPAAEIAAPPTLMNPTAMPTPNSSEVRQAKRRSAATQLARRGRSSTILTDTDALGG